MTEPEGRCACCACRFVMRAVPMGVHCCHCRQCQRETGSAFAQNALIETEHVELLAGETEEVVTPTASGAGQRIVRCARCRTPLWSHYGRAGDALGFVRVGALEDPSLCPPSVHLHTASKRDWVVLPEGVPRFEGFYEGKDVPEIFGEDGAARWRRLRESAR